MITAPLDSFNIFNVVRLFAIGGAAFFLNLLITHFWTKVLYTRFKPGKAIEREKETFWGETPIFNALHRKKEGTPTMGGLPIWLTVSIITLGCALLATVFGGIWSRVNFLSRSQTLLPLGFMILAGLVGMADDMIGVFKRGGLRMAKRLFFFLIVAGVGAWWFYFKLGIHSITVPFLGDYNVGWLYIPWVLLILGAPAFSLNETGVLDGLSGRAFL